jgi:hypothetical protein
MYICIDMHLHIWIYRDIGVHILLLKNTLNRKRLKCVYLYDCLSFTHFEVRFFSFRSESLLYIYIYIYKYIYMYVYIYIYIYTYINT